MTFWLYRLHIEDNNNYENNLQRVLHVIDLKNLKNIEINVIEFSWFIVHIIHLCQVIYWKFDAEKL